MQRTHLWRNKLNLVTVYRCVRNFHDNMYVRLYMYEICLWLWASLNSLLKLIVHIQRFYQGIVERNGVFFVTNEQFESVVGDVTSVFSSNASCSADAVGSRVPLVWRHRCASHLLGYEKVPVQDYMRAITCIVYMYMQCTCTCMHVQQYNAYITFFHV